MRKITRPQASGSGKLKAEELSWKKEEVTSLSAVVKSKDEKNHASLLLPGKAILKKKVAYEHSGRDFKA